MPTPLLTGDTLYYLWPRTLENRAALRTAVAALAAVFVSFFFQLHTPYWSGMTVVVVTNLYTGSIIDKAIMRLMGTIAGAFLGLYVAHFVANSLFLYIASCFLIISICVYFYNFSKYSYAYLLMALCAFIVIAQLSISVHSVFLVAIWRPVEIGIGVLISAISVYCIFPNHLKDSIPQQISAIFDDLSDEINQLSSCLHKETLDFAHLGENNTRLKKNLRQAFELIDAMRHEIGITQMRVDEIRAILDSCYELVRQIQYLIIALPEHNDLMVLNHLPIKPVFNAIEHDISQLKEGLLRSSNQKALLLKTQAVLIALESRCNDVSRATKTRGDVANTLLHFFQQINQQLMDMHALALGKDVTKNTSFKIIKREQRLQSDLDLMKHSIKAGLSVLLALYFWLLSHWPGGLNGIISSLIISIRKNLYEMKHISLHRVIGCLLGGGVALVSLHAFTMDLYNFAFVLFFSVWFFSYFMFKVPQYAYVGLQANIALIISLAQEGGPPLILSPSLQRLGGIFIGITASFIVGNIIWRADAFTVLTRYLKKLRFFLEFNMQQIFSSNHEQKSLHDLASLFWISRGLIESLHNERLAPNKQNQLRHLHNQFKSLVNIQAVVSHILASIDIQGVERAAESLGFNLKQYEDKLLQAFNARNKIVDVPLRIQLDQLQTEIEEASRVTKIDPDSHRGLITYIHALKQLIRLTETVHIVDSRSDGGIIQ